MDADDETVDFADAECLHETEKALLVKLEDRKVWVPLSQITDESEVRAKGDTGTLTVTSWFAERMES